VEDTPLVDSNEFVLGLGPEGDPNREWTEPWMRGGSFQVFRRLVQDVAGWRRRIKDWHEALGRPETPSEALLEARLIGRWRDGTPLAHAPGDKDLPLQDGARRKALHFRDDPDGERTPRTAHIRRMYPRNDRRFRDSKRRIIRRGITFGPPLPDGAEGAEGEGADRGLLFSAFMASIEGQFEYLQKAWANNPYFPGSVLGDRPDHAKEGVDPVIGSDPYPDRDGSLQSPMRGVSEHRPPSFERFVRTNGALYAFAPSLSTIRLLAEGALKE
jgi:Dyp-type peroxidase family